MQPHGSHGPHATNWCHHQDDDLEFLHVRLPPDQAATSLLWPHVDDVLDVRVRVRWQRHTKAFWNVWQLRVLAAKQGRHTSLELPLPLLLGDIHLMIRRRQTGLPSPNFTEEVLGPLLSWLPKVLYPLVAGYAEAARAKPQVRLTPRDSGIWRARLYFLHTSFGAFACRLQGFSVPRRMAEVWVCFPEWRNESAVAVHCARAASYLSTPRSTRVWGTWQC